MGQTKTFYNHWHKDMLHRRESPYMSNSSGKCFYAIMIGAQIRQTFAGERSWFSNKTLNLGCSKYVWRLSKWVRLGLKLSVGMENKAS